MHTHDPDSRMPPEHEAREHLWSLIKDIRFAMFTTRQMKTGQLQAWPMTTQNSRLDEDSSLWFFMSRRNEPGSDVIAAPDLNVNVSYADPGADSYVSVSGTAHVIEDRAKTERLWSKRAEAWFPQGPGDPDLALVQVRIIQASYWDVKASKLVQLFKMMKAAATGAPPKDLGEHAELRMS